MIDSLEEIKEDFSRTLIWLDSLGEEFSDKVKRIQSQYSSTFERFNNLLNKELNSKKVAQNQHQRVLVLLDERNAEINRLEKILREKDVEIAHLRGECKSFTNMFDMVFKALLEVSNERT